jgi:hypothetical protein
MSDSTVFGSSEFVGSQGFLEMKRRRLEAQIARVARELGRRGVTLTRSTRGSRHQIVCFTRLTPDGRRFVRFPSVSSAAISVGQKCDNICQSIKRNGTCGGHRFGYAAKLSPKFDEPRAVRDLKVHLRPSQMKRGRASAGVGIGGNRVAAAAC